MSEEIIAATAHRPVPEGFNHNAVIEHGMTVAHVEQALNAFCDFLSFVNEKLAENEMERLESFLMPANFSSIVGEFMTANLPKFCDSIAKNTYHNGHPDMVPAGLFPDNSVLHADQGIEVKASRYLKNWQGHNPEDVWLMVFVFDSNRPVDVEKKIAPKPFRFVKVVGARLEQADWKFAGRSATSRRTITASVQKSGFDKMEANWIYRDPELFPEHFELL